MAPNSGTDEPITLGELARNIERLREDLRGDFGSVREEMQGIRNQVASRDALTAMDAAWALRLQAAEAQWQSRTVDLNTKLGDMATRVSQLEGWLSWGQKIVLGIVITALVGLVVAGGGFGA